MTSHSFDGGSMIEENVDTRMLFVCSHFLFYNSIHIDFLSGLMTGVNLLSRYRWSIVSRGFDGNSAGVKRYN